MKYDIKHLTYIVGTVKSIVENIKDTLENGTLNLKNNEMISNTLTSNENIPIKDEETLQIVEKLLESSTFKHQIVSDSLILIKNKQSFTMNDKNKIIKKIGIDNIYTLCT